MSHRPYGGLPRLASLKVISNPVRGPATPREKRNRGVVAAADDDRTPYLSAASFPCGSLDMAASSEHRVSGNHRAQPSRFPSMAKIRTVELASQGQTAYAVLPNATT